MSAFPTLITWTAGQTVTASQMNTNVRDGSTWLKAALDLLTASTTADTGTATYIDVRRGSATDPAFRSGVSGAANPEFQIARNGKLSWGAGGGSAVDTFLERTSATTLLMTGDSVLRVERSAAGGNYFQGTISGDAANRISLKTEAGGGGRIDFGDGTTATMLQLYLSGTDGILSALTAGGSMRTLLGSADSAIWSSSAADAGNYFSIYNSAGAGTAVLRWLNGTTVDATLSYSSPYLQVGGVAPMFYASDGLRTRAVAGAVSDGSFSATPSSGHFALDTTNSRWYARSGTTWRYADLMGAFTYFGPFTYTNLAASASGLESDVAGFLTAGTKRVVPGYAGDVVCITVRGNANCTAGTATFRPAIGGVAGTLSAVIDSGTPSVVTSTQAPGIDVFTSTDGLNVVVTTTAGFLPTGSTEYLAMLGVLIRR